MMPPLVLRLPVDGGHPRAARGPRSTRRCGPSCVTVSIGYCPTLVSPDSITASAPSSTALATSEASARVGRGAEIIDSSIWVADDDRLGVAAGGLDDLLLQERHVLEGALDAEVAAGDHEAVEGLDDLVEVVDRLGLLDLGDDRQADADLVHDRPHVLDVRGAADEGQRDHVDGQAERPAQVVLVLLGHRGHRHRDARQVDALVVADRPPDHDPAADVLPVDVEDLEADPAVVDEHLVARCRRHRAARCTSSGDLARRARHVAGGDRRSRSPSARSYRALRRACRDGSSAPGGRPGPRRRGRRRRTPPGPSGRPSRGRRGCRGSGSAGRRPCRRRRARGSARSSRWPDRGCRRSWLYAHSHASGILGSIKPERA